jgi:hypothetical protein
MQHADKWSEEGHRRLGRQKLVIKAKMARGDTDIPKLENWLRRWRCGELKPSKRIAKEECGDGGQARRQ